MVNSTESSLDIVAEKKDAGKSFTSDVVTLVGGTTIAQIILVVTAPVITRLYGAEAFGLSALFTSLVGTLAIIACLRYELSIMLPRSDSEAVNLFALCILICLMMSLILIPIIWLLGDDLTLLFNTPGLRPYLWLLPLMVFLTGLFSAFSYWNSRKMKYGCLSKTQVVKVTTTSGTQLGIAYAGYASGGGLIGANVLGQAVATIVLGYKIWKDNKKFFHRNIRRKDIYIGMKKYIVFPKVDIWSALINILSLQAPIFILSSFFTTTMVGYYSLGLMVLQLPTVFIGSAIGQVFFQRAAQAKHINESELASVVEKTIVNLILLGFPLILSLLIIGKQAFTGIFGPNWSEAGVYAQILAIGILISFVASPLSSLINILNMFKLMFIQNIILFLIRTGVLIIGGLSDNIYLGLALYSISGAMIYSLFSRWIIIKSGASLSRIFISISKYVLLGLISLTLLFFITTVLVIDPLLIVVCGIFCLIPYYLILLSKNADIKILILRLLKKEHVR